MSENTSEVRFWTCDDSAEHLFHEDIGEAVESYVDSIHPERPPETVIVYGFAHEVIEPRDIDRIARYALEGVLENLDEDFGPLDEGTEATEAMREAARAFVGSVVAGYTVWRCKQVEQRAERVADHVPAEWLTTPTAEAP